MSKFKVGDKVRALHSASLPYNSVWTVSEIINNRTFRIIGREGAYRNNYYELVEPAPIEIPEVPFKDLTEDQKIALVSAGIRGEAIECKHGDNKWWPHPKSSTDGIRGFTGHVIYRIKPVNSEALKKLEELQKRQEQLSEEQSELAKAMNEIKESL